MATPNQQETCQTEQQNNTVEYVESVEPCMSHNEECMVPHPCTLREEASLSSSKRDGAGVILG